MKILFFGDVTGRPGRTAIAETLPEWRKQYQPDLVVANAENAAHGSGATPKTLQELQAAGVEAFTFGDHARFTDWSKLAEFPIVRPANMAGAGGVGSRIIETALGKKVLLLNLLGFAFLKVPGSDYFKAADELLKQYADEQPDAILVDFHAEATSETLVLGDYLDGRVSAVVGTHTHVPTADARILPGGTAFQADVGMCGVENSSLGVTYDSARDWLRNEVAGDRKKTPKTQAENRPYICDAVLIDTIDRQKSRSITRLSTRPQASATAK